MNHINPSPIAAQIYFIRGKKVLLDADLAMLYEVETKVLNQAVKRNIDRFPEDFMFQLTDTEYANWKAQQNMEEHVPSRAEVMNEKEYASPNLSSQIVNQSLRSQIVTLENQQGKHRKFLPYAFTEQGVAMLSGILRSPKAISANIAIMRAFVKMRELIDENKDLKRKLDELENKYDHQFKAVFQAIRELTHKKNEPMEPIGFKTSNQ